MIQYIIAAGIGALLGSSKKKAKKMGHGGKTQGYNSRLDESLSMRHGAGRKKQQSRKDRRDESAGMERSMGRRKYASVGTMDKGRRKMAHGGKVPDYLIDELSSKVTLRKSAVQQLVKNNHFSKDDVVSIITGIGRGQIYPMDVAMASLMGIGSKENENLVEFAKSGKAFDLARGGKTHRQGYDDKLDESLAMRKGAGRSKQQSRKDRRDESAAMERSMGRRKYASVRTMDRGRRRMAEGGIMSGSEERAIAEYMEDYGFDREQAEDQFLGEFRNKEEWAAEYVDNLGGIEEFYMSSLQPERFLEVDKIGFREWAMNMADAMSSDLDDSELEDAAERQGLKFEYMEAEEEGGKAFEDLRSEIAEKEYDEQYEYFMSEGDSVEGVLDLLGNYGVQGIEDASDLYVVRVDYEEVADALEDDGFVFIEEDFKTFVFDPNMRRGGRTKCTSCGNKRMAKGGQIPIPKEVLSGKEFIALALDKDGKPHMKFSKTFNGALRMAKNLDKKFDTGYAVQKYDPFLGNWFLEQNIFIPSSKEFRKGGKTKRKKVSDFDKLAMKVAARYRAEGKSNEEAMEIGRGTAAKVYRAQQAKRGAKGRKGRK